MNLSLLCKWLWKIDREDGLWQQIIKFKYLRKDTICSVHHKQSDSPIWADLPKVRDIYIQGRKFIIGNGKKILFWKDRWLFDQPVNAKVDLQIQRANTQSDIQSVPIDFTC
jgi:hypothetical protein